MPFRVHLYHAPATRTTVRFAAMCALFACGQAAADTLLVPQQYPTLKLALTAAQNGDTVLVAPGVFEVADGIFNGASGKSLTIQGSGQGVTVLTIPFLVDIGLIGPALGDPITVSGFTFVPAAAGQLGGRATFQRNVDVTACEFHSLRSAEFRADGPMGAGPVLVAGCTFSGRWDDEQPTVRNCPNGPVLVSGCVFSTTVTVWGGEPLASALQVVNYDPGTPDSMVIRDSGFMCCTGQDRGALVGNPSRIDGCLFAHNSAQDIGAAIVLTPTERFVAPTVITGCHFFDNSAPVGGAVLCWAGTLADISNCEFANNTADYAGAIYSAGPVLVNNCIFCGNTGGDILAGGTYGSGNSFDSSCDEDCDQDGIPDASAIALGLVDDVDGDGVPDHCSPQYFSADLNGDCVVDGADLGIVIAGWASASGVGDVNKDGLVDGSDLALVLGQWSD